MTRVLAIGEYTENDAQALTGEEGAKIVASFDEVAALSEDDRAEVEGMAFKGHESYGPEQMDLTPNLKVIANFGVGYDAIDIPAATERGIKVTNTPNVLNDDVADLAVGMWIAQGREFEKGMAEVRSGGWAKNGALPLARKVSGRKVGILGMGRIGREIADRLAAFKAEIHYQSRKPKDAPEGWTYHETPLDLARAVDDMVIAIVGGPDTKGIVSAEVIGALGEDGVIVNISRGTVIDEEALIKALETGQIRGAALDVFLKEPDADPRLTAMANVLPLPHIGSATSETRAEMGRLQRRNLRAVLDGKPAETPVN